MPTNPATATTIIRYWVATKAGGEKIIGNIMPKSQTGRNGVRSWRRIAITLIEGEQPGGVDERNRLVSPINGLESAARETPMSLKGRGARGTLMRDEVYSYAGFYHHG